jgi:hypothetical protein
LQHHWRLKLECTLVDLAVALLSRSYFVKVGGGSRMVLGMNPTFCNANLVFWVTQGQDHYSYLPIDLINPPWNSDTKLRG